MPKKSEGRDKNETKKSLVFFLYLFWARKTEDMDCIQSAYLPFITLVDNYQFLTTEPPILAS